jgi:hypothetical protein
VFRMMRGPVPVPSPHPEIRNVIGRNVPRNLVRRIPIRRLPKKTGAPHDENEATVIAYRGWNRSGSRQSIGDPREVV